VAFGDYARVRVRGESAFEAELRGRFLGHPKLCAG
jgi:hypothetical protein